MAKAEVSAQQLLFIQYDTGMFRFLEALLESVFLQLIQLTRGSGTIILSNKNSLLY